MRLETWQVRKLAESLDKLGDLTPTNLEDAILCASYNMRIAIIRARACSANLPNSVLDTVEELQNYVYSREKERQAGRMARELGSC